jgi:hypothetical protein
MNRPCRELLGGVSLSSLLKINPLFFLPLTTPFMAVGGRPHCNRIEFSLNRFIFTNVHPNITGAPRSRGIATTITSDLFCLSFRSPPKPTIFALLFHGSSSFNLPEIMKLRVIRKRPFFTCHAPSLGLPAAGAERCKSEVKITRKCTRAGRASYFQIKGSRQFMSTGKAIILI